MPQIVLMDTQKKHSFNRLVGKFSTKAEVFFPWISKTEKNILFRKRFASQCSYGRKEKLFRPIYCKFFYKTRQFLAQSPQVIKSFFSKPVVSTKCFFLDTWKAVLTNLLEFFRQMPENFCSLADSDKVWHFFQREQFSSQCSYGNVECAFDNSIDFLNK